MRVTGRIVSALLALALGVGGVLVALEVLVARLGRQPVILDYPRWDRYARTNTWQSPSFRWLMLLSCVIGLVLIILGLAHRRPLVVETVGVGSPTRITVQRSTLESALADEGERLDGVARANVRIDRGVAKVSARSNRVDADGLDRSLTARIEQCLSEWGLAGRLDVRTRVSPRGRS